MNKREKLAAALQHREGKIPFDLGGTTTTGIHVSVIEELRDYYGLCKRPVKVAEPLQMLGVVEDDLKQAMGIDTVNVWNPCNMFGFHNEGEKEWKTPWGQTVLVPEKFVTDCDDKGNTYIYVDGDKSCAPSGKLPAGGYFFDVIVRGHDFDEDEPHIEDNLEEFGPISDAALQSIKMQMEQVRKSPYAVVGSFGGSSFGDVAMVPGSMLKHPKGLRDISEWYMATLSAQDYIHDIFTVQADWAVKNLQKVYEITGDDIQAVFVCGTDFGTQNAPFCSNELFRELYMPYYKKVNGWIHENTKWKTFKHSCGSIMALIPEMIESGFDILNPVQWTAQNMDARQLKKEFGKDIVFWGGGVDTQKTFAFGTPEEVREQVLEVCSIFAEGGGFVYHAIHNIQALTPVTNVVAMADALKEFNGEKS